MSPDRLIAPLRPRITFNAAGVPDELRREPRWVGWKLLPPKKPGEKPRKLPINPITGRAASSTDSTTWGTFEQAVASVRHFDLAGVGFVLSGSGFSGLDLDECRNPETGEIQASALDALKKLDTYSEVSPSGTGVHAIVRGVKPKGKCRREHVEMYAEGRYFTITGVCVPGTPPTVEERQEQITALHAELLGKDESPKAAKSATDNVQKTLSSSTDDDEILKRAGAARNHPKFDRLWSGNTQGYPSPSEADLALCGIFAYWTRKDPEQVDRLFRRSKLMREKWDELRGGQTYGAMTIAKAIAGAKDRPQHTRRARSPAPTGGGNRPVINAWPGKIHQVVRQAEDVLLNLPSPAIFQRDRVLVRVVVLPNALKRDGIVRPSGAAIIQEVDVAFLVCLLTEHATWFAPTRKGMRPCDAPAKVALTLLASAGTWKLPVLHGVIQAPTLRRDGSVLQTPGYDAASGLFFDDGGIAFGPIPEFPTREEALAELDRITSILKDFPFREDSDRSTAVAAILTALVRRMLKTAPMFVFGAPVRASGKTLLADLPSLIATGRSCAFLAAGRDETEEQKRIFAILMEGDLVACFDNVERPLGGQDLCIVLTSELYQGRLLGASKMLKLPTCTMWCATGNNIIIEGDLPSRVLPCDIDPQSEAPEKRTFEIDLRDYVLAHRAELVRAGLVVMRAYHAAGRPKLGLSTFGRFENWSDTVRAPLVWLGMTDPLNGVVRLHDQDPVVARIRMLVHPWAHRFGTEPITVAEVVRVVQHDRESPLYDALMEIASNQAGSVDPKVVGAFLRKVKGRIVDGVRFVRTGTTHGSARWRLETVRGGQGGQLSPPREENDTSCGQGGSEECSQGEGAEAVPPVPPDHAQDVAEAGS